MIGYGLSFEPAERRDFNLDGSRPERVRVRAARPTTAVPTHARRDARFVYCALDRAARVRRQCVLVRAHSFTYL